MLVLNNLYLENNINSLIFFSFYLCKYDKSWFFIRNILIIIYPYDGSLFGNVVEIYV